jgi:hypothetical protein
VPVLGFVLALAEPVFPDSDFEDADALDGDPESAELLLLTD